MAHTLKDGQSMWYDGYKISYVQNPIDHMSVHPLPPAYFVHLEDGTRVPWNTIHGAKRYIESLNKGN